MSPTSSSLSPRRSALGLLVAASLVGAFALAPRAALAADLDGGYAEDVPSLPQQMVTFGSGWYVRGDLAATELDSLLVVRTPTKEAAPPSYRFGTGPTEHASYDASLGAGYAFTNSFRVDVTGDFFQPTQSKILPDECASSTARTCYSVGQFNRYAALINGYYDFGPWWIVTPYIGAGAGIGFGQVDTTLYGDTGTYLAHNAYHSFAFALMAGLAFDIYPHVKLDIGYRYLNEGNVFGNTIADQEVRAGLRYMIDN